VPLIRQNARGSCSGSSLVDLEILGVGMAAAVLIDATVVRGVLLPATLGDHAWHLRRRHADAQA
jgi:hypothetical protein